jgi:putative ABC transport system permease protein
VIKNYLKIAFRNLFRYKGYSFINIAGLAIGIACCMLILVYLQYEMSFDKFIKDYPQIYRVLTKNPTKFIEGEYIEDSPLVLASRMKEELPEVVGATRYSTDAPSRTTITAQGISLLTAVSWADSTFVDIFNYPVYRGDLREALRKPYSMAITKSAARKLYGTEDAIGKMAKLGTVFDVQVNAVLEDIPETSNIQFDCIVSYATRTDYWKEEIGMGIKGIFFGGKSLWGHLCGNTYVKLQSDVDPVAFELRLNSWLKSKLPQDIDYSLKIQPITDIHLKGNPTAEVKPHGDIRYVYLLSAIAILILLIATFNYMNLSTARSSTRAREIGLRKIFGGTRVALTKQFFGESIIVTGIAVVMGIILAELALPAFNSLVELDLKLDLLHNQFIQFGVLGITVCVSVLAGIYPALYLSSMHVHQTIRGMTTTNPRGSSFMRGVLVVFQNVISITLIICTIIILQQLSFLKNKDLGMDTNQVIAIPVKDYKTLKGLDALRQEMANYPGVKEVALSESVPFEGFGGASGCWWEGKRETDESFHIYTNSISSNFLDCYEMQLVEGRPFSDTVPSDANHAYIINEAAMKAMGWTTAVGRRFGISEKEKGIIIGVVKDFNYASLRKPLEPLAMYLSPRNIRCDLSVKLTGENTSGVIEHLKSIWKNYSTFPFDYYYLSDRIALDFKSEDRLARVFSYSAAFAVLVACLGLFGLAAFGVERRTREIAVRKILGGSINGIVGSLARDFIRWVLIANVLAWPIAYYAMQRWLQSYPYRTSLGIGDFILSGLCALIIALLTVSYQSVKAATANPVDSLRYE